MICFKYKLLGFFTRKSPYSTDELTTLYHFPDINYNKSPIIVWLGYKKVSPPINLKTPKDLLIMADYIRDGEYVITEDGTKLKTDKYGNILRGKNDGFITERDEEILMETE